MTKDYFLTGRRRVYHKYLDCNSMEQAESYDRVSKDEVEDLPLCAKCGGPGANSRTAGKSENKHPCPLCGEYVYLTKHLPECDGKD